MFLLVAGCSSNEAPNKEEVKQEVKHDQKQDQKQVSEINQNKDLTKKVKEEEGVIEGQVYEQGDIAIGTLVLEKKVNNKDAKKLAEKYADE